MVACSAINGAGLFCELSSLAVSSASASAAFLNVLSPLQYLHRKPRGVPSVPESHE